MNDIKSGYAKALFDLAVETNDLKSYLNEVEAFEQLYDDKLMVFLNAHSISKEEKKRFITEVLKDFNQYFINFLNVIIDRKMTSFLPEIISLFKKLAFEKLNIGILKIYSAKKISDQHLNTITSNLKDREYRVLNIIDEKLLAGYKLVIDDKNVLDATLLKQLNDLKEELIKEGN